MAGTKISALAALTTLADGDLLPIVDVSDPGSGTTKQVTAANVAGYTSAEVVATLPFSVIPGLVEGGSGDNTAAINAALTAREAAGGGTVTMPAGNYGWSGEIIVPQYVDLWCAGGGWSPSPTLHMTRLVATGTGAKITFESSGGTSGNFVVDGDEIATGSLFHRKLGAERMFQSIHVRQSLGEGIRVDEAQNDLWVNVQSYGHTGASLVLDNGCGGHKFEACEIGGTADWCLIITETSGTGPYGTIGPGHNTFDHCLFEYAKATTFDGCVDVHGGERNVFRDCVFSGSGYETTVGLVRTNVDAAGGSGTSSVEFTNCWFFGATTGSRLGIVQTAGTLRISGDTLFQSMITAWTYTAGLGKVADEITYNGVTNRWAGAGSVATILNSTTRPLEIKAETTDTFSFRVYNQGDTGTRFDITPTGAFLWGNGAGANDAILYRSAAAKMTFLSTGVITDRALEMTGTAGAGFIDFLEQSSDAAAGAANHARLFAKDNGSGKTQLVVRFPSGATQVIATEP